MCNHDSRFLWKQILCASLYGYCGVCWSAALTPGQNRKVLCYKLRIRKLLLLTFSTKFFGCHQGKLFLCRLFNFNLLTENISFHFLQESTEKPLKFYLCSVQFVSYWISVLCIDMNTLCSKSWEGPARIGKLETLIPHWLQSHNIPRSPIRCYCGNRRHGKGSIGHSAFFGVHSIKRTGCILYTTTVSICDLPHIGCVPPRADRFSINSYPFPCLKKCFLAPWARPPPHQSLPWAPAVRRKIVGSFAVHSYLLIIQAHFLSHFVVIDIHTPDTYLNVTFNGVY